MKVLLLEDVINLGVAGDVVAVADGYGRNYLIPRNLAKAATPGSLNQAAQIRRTGERKRARELATARELARRIEALELTFKARAGETGKLYGSVTTADLAEAMERELGQEIDRRKIVSDPLRQLGDHAIQVRLMTDVSATLKVVIQPEDGEGVGAAEGVPTSVAPEETAEEAATTEAEATVEELS